MRQERRRERRCFGEDYDFGTKIGDRFQVKTFFSFFLENNIILGQKSENRRLISSEDLFEARKLKQIRKVARKSEEVGPPCSRKFGLNLEYTSKFASRDLFCLYKGDV